MIDDLILNKIVHEMVDPTEEDALHKMTEVGQLLQIVAARNCEIFNRFSAVPGNYSAMERLVAMHEYINSVKFGKNGKRWVVMDANGTVDLCTDEVKKAFMLSMKLAEMRIIRQLPEYRRCLERNAVSTS